MRETIVKYGLFYAAALVVGVGAWWLTRGVVDAVGIDAAGGSRGASVLTSASVVAALLRGAGAVVLAMIMAGLSARLVNGVSGLLCGGVVLVWGAAGVGSLRGIVITGGESTVGRAMLLLAGETLLAGIAAVGVVMVVMVASGRGERGGPLRRPHWPTALTSALWLGAACGAAGMLGGVWLMAQSGDKGQAIGAALVGGLLGGVLASAVVRRSEAEGGGESSHDAAQAQWPLMLGVVGGGALALAVVQVAAVVMGPGNARLYAAVVSGTVWRWSQVVGLDAAAGALCGLPIGLYVAKGLLGHAAAKAKG